MAGLIFIVFTVLGIAFIRGSNGLDDEMAEVAKALRDSCISETGQKEALLIEINGGADIPDDSTLKCYMKCVMENAGMLSDGVVDIESIISLLPEDMRVRNEPTIRKCGSPKGSDDCDTAWLTQTCWQKTDKPNYMLI